MTRLITGLMGQMHMSRTATRTPKPPTSEPGDGSKDARITDPDRRRTTALHEAGHTIVALVLGLRFTRVEIDADTDNGRVWHPAQAQCSIAQRCIFRLAGAAAEAVASGWDVLELCASDCVDDWQAVLVALREDRTRQLRLNVLAATSRALVAEHWREVEVLAQALLERGHLTYTDVTAILTSR